MDDMVRNDIDFSCVPFSVIKESEHYKKMGLVVLQTDLTVETEMRFFLSNSISDESIDYDKNSVSLLHTRIPCKDEVNVKNLSVMESKFSEALGLFPEGYEFDVVAYACTSASLIIGEDKINSIFHSKLNTKNVTTPLTAVKRGLRSLNVERIGFLAPYISDISLSMCHDLCGSGLRVVSAATFQEGKDSIVGNISPESILLAIESLIKKAPQVQAVFIACTSLKCVSVIKTAEEKYGIPILSSNSALAWDMMRLSKLDGTAFNKGMLFTKAGD